MPSQLLRPTVFMLQLMATFEEAIVIQIAERHAAGRARNQQGLAAAAVRSGWQASHKTAALGGAGCAVSADW